MMADIEYSECILVWQQCVFTETVLKVLNLDLSLGWYNAVPSFLDFSE